MVGPQRERSLSPRVAAVLIALWAAGCLVTTDDNLWKHQDGSTGKDAAVVIEGSVSAEGQHPDTGVVLTDGPRVDVEPGDGPSPDTSQPDAQKLPAGSACSQPGECASGHCVDSVCCDASCAGPCEACDLPGHKGTCTLIQAGSDPDDECAQQVASTCGVDGFCDGKGACRLYAAGTICGSSACVGNDTLVKQCDGAGQCVKGPKTSCLPYKCNSATGACYTSCSSDAQCVAYRCTWLTAKCRSTCSSNYHCQSGFNCKNNKCAN